MRCTEVREVVVAMWRYADPVVVVRRGWIPDVEIEDPDVSGRGGRSWAATGGLLTGHSFDWSDGCRQLVGCAE